MIYTANVYSNSGYGLPATASANMFSSYIELIYLATHTWPAPLAVVMICYNIYSDVLYVYVAILRNI